MTTFFGMSFKLRGSAHQILCSQVFMFVIAGGCGGAAWPWCRCRCRVCFATPCWRVLRAEWSGCTRRPPARAAAARTPPRPSPATPPLRPIVRSGCWGSGDSFNTNPVYRTTTCLQRRQQRQAGQRATTTTRCSSRPFMSVKPVLSVPPFKRSIHSQTVCALADLAVLAWPPNSNPAAIC